MTRALRAGERAGVTAGLVGTAVLHGVVLVVLLLLARAPEPFLATVYQVELVAAPAPTTARRVATEAIAPPPPRTAPVQDRTTRTTPVTPPAPPRAQPRTEPAPRVANPVEPLPGETPSTGTNIANVRVEGVAFEFPEYLQNIVEQVYRRWNRPPVGTPLRAEVAFTIFRDGTVREIRMLVSSRNFTFDLEARGAIEAAAQSRAFGPLPAGFQGESLPIAFYFAPRTAP